MVLIFSNLGTKISTTKITGTKISTTKITGTNFSTTKITGTKISDSRISLRKNGSGGFGEVPLPLFWKYTDKTLIFFEFYSWKNRFFVVICTYNVPQLKLFVYL